MKVKEIVNHIQQWNEWRKRNTNSKFWKFMVLTKFVSSPTFEAHKTFRDLGNVRNH